MCVQKWENVLDGILFFYILGPKLYFLLIYDIGWNLEVYPIDITLVPNHNFHWLMVSIWVEIGKTILSNMT